MSVLHAVLVIAAVYWVTRLVFDPGPVFAWARDASRGMVRGVGHGWRALSPLGKGCAGLAAALVTVAPGLMTRARRGQRRDNKNG